MEKWEKDPTFDTVGMFIAEWNGEPVRRVKHAPLLTESVRKRRNS